MKVYKKILCYCIVFIFISTFLFPLLAGKKEIKDNEDVSEDVRLKYRYLDLRNPAMQEKLELTILTKRTAGQRQEQSSLPYTVNVVSLDHPGIVSHLAEFFSNRNINIQDLYTDSYPAAHTGTPMFTATLTVNIPGNISIAGLREEFLDFCDSLNLDGILEPSKG